MPFWQKPDVERVNCWHSVHWHRLPNSSYRSQTRSNRSWASWPNYDRFDHGPVYDNTLEIANQGVTATKRYQRRQFLLIYAPFEFHNSLFPVVAILFVCLTRATLLETFCWFVNYLFSSRYFIQPSSFLPLFSLLPIFCPLILVLPPTPPPPPSSSSFSFLNYVLYSFLWRSCNVLGFIKLWPA